MIVSFQSDDPIHKQLDTLPPRPYDFRHRFAFANIERWTRDGVDVMAMLPYLAAYMGHAGIDSTLYYVHASPDFMDGYADLVADAERVVPETEEP